MAQINKTSHVCGCRPHILFFILLVLQILFAEAVVLKKRADPHLERLPARSTEFDRRWQPGVDFDKDSCYQVPAIDPRGVTSQGLPASSDDYSLCRRDLANTNTYSRRRCNSGWCVTIYAYYFEKDYSAGTTTGHRHDWEHIAVWIKNDQSGTSNKFVCPSAHGGYHCLEQGSVRWEGDHPLIVYHKDGLLTHAFRFANDDEDPENELDTWFRAPLVSWDGYCSESLRQTLQTTDFGSAALDISDAKFSGAIDNAIPRTFCQPGQQGCSPVKRFSFDTGRDEGSAGAVGGEPCPGGDGGGGGGGGGGGAIKGMFVGDSITHGGNWDFTWRYRLWEWLNKEGISTNFVGPYRGTFSSKSPEDAKPKPPLLPGELRAEPDPYRGQYAPGVSSAFPTAHYSKWGRQAAQVFNEIGSVVSTHQPDYIFLFLGFNDIGWFVSGPEGTLQSVEKIVRNAQRAKPLINILVSNIPQRTLIKVVNEQLPAKTTDFNNRLKNAVGSWSTGTSKVRLVDVQSNYDCGPNACADGYDGLHPNPLGEFHIAQSFADVLRREYGFGKNGLTIQGVPQRTVTTPQNFKATSVPAGIVVNWNSVQGARGYDLRTRRKGETEWGLSSTDTNAYWTTWTWKGDSWEYQVRSSAGDNVKSGWSGTQSATADPQTAPGPQNIVGRSTGSGISATWDVVLGYNVDRYELLAYDVDEPGAFVASMATKGLSATVPGLKAGHRHVVGVVTWTSIGGGPPSTGSDVVV